MVPSADGATPSSPVPPTKRHRSQEPLFGCIRCSQPSLVAVYSTPPAAVSKYTSSGASSAPSPSFSSLCSTARVSVTNAHETRQQQLTGSKDFSPDD